MFQQNDGMETCTVATSLVATMQPPPLSTVTKSTSWSTTGSVVESMYWNGDGDIDDRGGALLMTSPSFWEGPEVHERDRQNSEENVNKECIVIRNINSRHVEMVVSELDARSDVEVLHNRSGV